MRRHRRRSARGLPEGSAESARDLLPSPLLPRGAGALLLAAVAAGLSSAVIWTFGLDMLAAEGGMSQSASVGAWSLLGAFGVLGAGAGATWPGASACARRG